MEYIIDTHTLLWIVDDDPQLSKKVRSIYLNPANDIYISLASIWELVIKVSLKKLIIDDSIGNFVNTQIKGNSIRILEIKLNHITALENLPYYHRDPFDRLIISQSMLEKIPVLSNDNFFDKYPIKRIW